MFFYPSYKPTMFQNFTIFGSEFSIERLLTFVLALGFDIEITPKLHKTKSTCPRMHIITDSLNLPRLGT